MEENKPVNDRTGKSMKELTAEKRASFETACQHEDMIGYLIETDGLTRNAARERLKYQARSYPDIAEKHDFWNRFDKTTKCKPKQFEGWVNHRTKKAIENYHEAASKDDPIAFMMEKFGIERKKAVHNYNQWRVRYGKIEKIEKQEGNMDETNDEISVEDFLDQNFTQIVETPKIVPLKGNDFCGELNAKYAELECEKEKLEARLAWIKQAQDALSMTAKLFG